MEGQHDRETLIVHCRRAPWYSGKTDKGEHSSSTARLPGRASSLCPTMRCGMQRGFFGFQFVDQPLSSIDRHPIENLALNPPIAPNVPIDLVAFFAHGICAPMRRPCCRRFLYVLFDSNFDHAPWQARGPFRTVLGCEAFFWPQQHILAARAFSRLGGKPLCIHTAAVVAGMITPSDCSRFLRAAQRCRLASFLVSFLVS